MLLVAEAAPHLVHHLLDGDGAPECLFLAAADHTPAAAAVALLSLAPPAAAPFRVPPARPSPPTSPAQPVSIRSPPGLLLAAA